MCGSGWEKVNHTQGQQSLWEGRSLELTFKDQQRGPERGSCLDLSVHENM